MTWNQNPAQPPTAYDDIMNKLGAAKGVNNRDPFIPTKSHDLIVASIVAYQDQKHGPSVRATFEIESTSNPGFSPGQFVVKIWNLFKPSKFESQTNDADEFANFVCLLQGVRLGQHFESCKALIKTAAEGGQMERQPARGARIKAFGVDPKPGKTYVKVEWQTVPQDMARIAQTRAELDQRRPLGAPVAAPQPAPMAPQGSPYAQLPQGQGPYTAPPGAGYGQPISPAQLPPGVVPGGYGSYSFTPQAPPAAPGGYSAMMPTAAPQPAPAKPPWNPAWGPMPPGY